MRSNTCAFVALLTTAGAVAANLYAAGRRPSGPIERPTGPLIRPRRTPGVRSTPVIGVFNPREPQATSPEQKLLNDLLKKTKVMSLQTEIHLRQKMAIRLLLPELKLVLGGGTVPPVPCVTIAPGTTPLPGVTPCVTTPPVPCVTVLPNITPLPGVTPCPPAATSETGPRILIGRPRTGILDRGTGPVIRDHRTGGTTSGSVPGPTVLPDGTIQLPVTANAVWKVYETDASGGNRREISGSGPQRGFVQEGNPLETPTFQLAPLRFVEMTSPPNVPVSHLLIEPVITLQATLPNGTKITSFDSTQLGVPLATRLTMPALAIPKILAFFRHPDFKASADAGTLKNGQGFVLVVVPEHSVLDEKTIKTANGLANHPVLQNLESTLATLSVFSHLVPGGKTVRELITAVRSQNNFKILKRDEIKSFNDIDMVYGTVNNLEAEDETSALIFLGPPGKQVIGYQDRGFKGGQMQITIGDELGVIVRSFYRTTGPADRRAPRSEPEGRVEILKSFGKDNTPGDRLSGMKFPN